MNGIKTLEQLQMITELLSFEANLKVNYRNYFQLLRETLQNCRKFSEDENLNSNDKIQKILADLNDLNRLLPDIVKV
jgi:hypothetical protein